ncbi:MAG: hypothetical protein H6704_11930 [Myxococcales bacterium]|nr:hypothetical protein [Myxococcales bacterium]
MGRDALRWALLAVALAACDGGADTSADAAPPAVDAAHADGAPAPADARPDADSACAENDADGDLFLSAACGGSDCDDADPAVHPGAEDVFGDDRDTDCDGADGVDRDGDGAAGGEGPDCDDGDPTRHPGAEDPAGDGVDQDCDGADGVDRDGDGWLFEPEGDCDDGDPNRHPGAPDPPGDGVDQDCDGTDGGDADGDGVPPPADCDDADPDRHPGADDPLGDGVDQDCDGADGFDADGDGAQRDQDCADDDPARFPGAVDAVGDAIDQDCDGVDGVDRDGDGHASAASGGQDCADDDADVHPGAADALGDGLDADCDGVDGTDADGDGVLAGEDCDDADPLTYPGAEDSTGDGRDRNCDGRDGTDADVDGSDSVASGGRDCDDADPDVRPGRPDPFGDGRDTDCDGSDGVDADGDGHRALDNGGDDCVDFAADTFPGAPDRVGDGLDQDCDGVDGVDADGDGYASTASAGSDCDDQDATVHPGVAEPDDWTFELVVAATARDADLCVDALGRVHAAWLEGPPGPPRTVRYATRDDEGWRIEDVAPAAARRHVALACADDVALAWWAPDPGLDADALDGLLQVAVRADDGWASTEVGATADVRGAPALQRGEAGLRAAWADRSAGTLTVVAQETDWVPAVAALWAGAGGGDAAWVQTREDATMLAWTAADGVWALPWEGGGAERVTAMPGDGLAGAGRLGVLHLSWVDLDAGVVRHARRGAAGTWGAPSRVADFAGAVARPTGVALAPDRTPRVAWLAPAPGAPGTSAVFVAARAGATWSTHAALGDVDADAGRLPLRGDAAGGLHVLVPRHALGADGQRRLELTYGHRPPTDGLDPGCNGE